MKAADVMVANVVSTTPDASVQEVAALLIKHRISAVPVLTKDGELAGIVSEGDLMRRKETNTEHHRSWWMQLLLGRSPLAAEYIKAHSNKVSDVMTRDVVTATPDTPLRDVAALLEKHGIKRVPILRNGKLVGIVSRANLVQALATQTAPVQPSTEVDDLTIREEVMARLDGKAWTAFAPINVIVEDGVVHLWGTVDSETVKRAVWLAVEETSGVQAINDHLVVERVSAYM
jgi:CBS-domain-containing membrane protein